MNIIVNPNAQLSHHLQQDIGLLHSSERRVKTGHAGLHRIGRAVAAYKRRLVQLLSVSSPTSCCVQ